MDINSTNTITNILILIVSLITLILILSQYFYKNKRNTIKSTFFGSEYQTLPVASFKSTNTGDLIFANHHYDSMIGFNETSDSFNRKNWLNLLDPQDRDKIAKERLQVFFEGQNFQIETRINRRPGEFQWVQISEMPVKDNQGRLKHYVGTMIYIPTYEKIEFENKIWRVIDRVSTNLLILNQEDDILKVLLQIVCEDLGWDLAQVFLKKTKDNNSVMILKSSYSFTPHKYNKLIKDSQSRIFNVGEGIPGIVWQTKQAYWVADISEKTNYPRREVAMSENITTCLAVPIFVNDEIYGVLEIFSEQKQQKNDSVIRGMNVISTFFSKAIERQLQQKIENEYREQLTRNAKLSSMGEMASGIAHEINNPLTVIRGHTHLIMRTLELAAEESPLEKIRHSTLKIVVTLDRISKIIKGLKNISRDSENDPFVLTTAKHIIDDTLSLCESKIKNAEVTLKIEPFDETISLECRSYQISQILINLLNNSVDAIEKLDERWIEIALENSDSHLKIMVTDSGKGIPDEIAEKITQAFFTTKEFGKGTGLGLSITKGIIEAHGGEFGLVRGYKNTRFFVKLLKKQPIRLSNQAA